MDEHSRKFTAFIVPDGHYEFFLEEKVPCWQFLAALTFI